MIKTFKEFLEEGYSNEEIEDSENLVLKVFDKNVEFKPTNEEGILTYMEADELMNGEWEMLSGEEWDYIRDNYECVWDNEQKGLLIDGRILLPSVDGKFGEYWVPEHIGPDRTFETFYFDDEGNVEQGYKEENEKCQVRLVRYV